MKTVDNGEITNMRFISTCVCLTTKSNRCRTNKCACNDIDCQCHKQSIRNKKVHRFFSNTNLQYLFQATIVGVLSVTTMSAPLPLRNNQNYKGSTIPSDQPKWVNPCGFPGHVFDPERDMRNAPKMPVEEIYTRIFKTAYYAHTETNKIKADFVETEFEDESFEEGVASYRQEWLPIIPKPTVEHFSTITREEALRKSFELLQYFAVGIEEILLDATLHDSSFRDKFKGIENYLSQLLCDVQMGMYVLGVPRNPDVLRDVMSQEYRDMPDKTARLVRDYLILRDYGKTVNYIAELFAYLKTKL